MGFLRLRLYVRLIIILKNTLHLSPTNGQNGKSLYTKKVQLRHFISRINTYGIFWHIKARFPDRALGFRHDKARL